MGKTLEGLLGNLARYTVITSTALIDLAQFGVQTGNLIAIFVVAGQGMNSGGGVVAVPYLRVIL